MLFYYDKLSVASSFAGRSTIRAMLLQLNTHKAGSNRNNVPYLTLDRTLDMAGKALMRMERVFDALVYRFIQSACFPIR